jgi:endonuclease III-like uncharacterized protein
MFRFLSKDEEITFRRWARDNYTPFTEISELWHPVVQEECRKMCEEKQIHFRCEIERLIEEQLNN